MLEILFKLTLFETYPQIEVEKEYIYQAYIYPKGRL